MKVIRVLAKPGELIMGGKGIAMPINFGTKQAKLLKQPSPPVATTTTTPTIPDSDEPTN